MWSIFIILCFTHIESVTFQETSWFFASLRKSWWLWRTPGRYYLYNGTSGSLTQRQSGNLINFNSYVMVTPGFMVKAYYNGLHINRKSCAGVSLSTWVNEMLWKKKKREIGETGQCYIQSFKGIRENTECSNFREMKKKPQCLHNATL